MTLEDVDDAIWTALVRGRADRRSPLHTPVVATVDAQGRPQARVMVLRGVERAARTLRFHTDVRSAKWRQGDQVTVVGYDAGQKVQIRLSGSLTFDAESTDVDRAWAGSTLFSRRCYLVEPGPGARCDEGVSGLPADMGTRAPTEAEAARGRTAFGILRVEVDAIDWLLLAARGHRRAQLAFRDGQWDRHWVVP